MANEPVTTLIGNVGGDPDLRFLPSGVPVCNFSVGATPRVKDGDRWVDGETMWVRCAAWRQLAENVAESIVRGTRVVVTGRLKVRTFEQDGTKRTSIEMDVDAIGPELTFATAKVNKVSRSSDGGSSGGGRSGTSGGAAADPWGSAAGPVSQDSEPPF